MNKLDSERARERVITASSTYGGLRLLHLKLIISREVSKQELLHKQQLKLYAIVLVIMCD